MAEKSSLHYGRILLKISGEALAGSDKFGLDPVVVSAMAEEVKKIHDLGVEVVMVIGAGNFFRGAIGEKLGINRVTGDHMGMLATVMNSLAMKNELLKRNVPTRVLSAIEMNEVAEPYIIDKADAHLQRGEVVIASGGTGHPYFTTDTAASLRGVELGVDVLIKATRVDGVYTSDPEKDSSAVKLTDVTFYDVIKDRLRVMDLTAISLCMDNNLPIIVMNLYDTGALEKLCSGERIGTLIHK